MTEIKEDHIKKFKSLARSMDKLMREICKYNPEANIYVEDSWNVILMKGPTHTEEKYGQAIFDNAVTCETIYKASGGGW